MKAEIYRNPMKKSRSIIKKKSTSAPNQLNDKTPEKTFNADMMKQLLSHIAEMAFWPMLHLEKERCRQVVVCCWERY